MKDLFQSRKFRQGSVATAITVAVIALVVVVNLIATALTDRYSLTLDLTPGKVFSITDETKEYLAQVDKDVTIYVLDTEESFSGKNEYYLQTAEVLKKYALASDAIRLEFVDLLANPAFAQNYPALQLSSSSILIECGDKVRDLAPYELYDIQSNAYGQGQIAASKAEQVLTSALLAVTSDNAVHVAVLTGHNEEPATALTDLLSSNNYLVGDEVNLATSDIDPLYTVAVINAPQRDFTEDELRRLDTFLKNGGAYGRTLLYFASSEQTDLPNLSAFLEDWGISVRPGMVYETDSSRYIPGFPYMAVLDYAEDEYSKEAAANRQVPLAAYARPMETAFDAKSSVSTGVLLEFAGTAGIVESEDIVHEPSGTIPYLILGQHSSYEGGETLRSQVAAFGSSSFVDSSFLNNPNFANAEYTLSLLAGLTGREEPIQIKSKDLGGTVMDISAFQALTLGGLLVIVLPLVVLISGLVIWARRRHR